MPASTDPLAFLHEDDDQANDDQSVCSELVLVEESDAWQQSHLPQVDHTNLPSDADSLFDDNESIGSAPAFGEESKEEEIRGEVAAPADDSADMSLDQAMWDELNRSEGSDVEESEEDDDDSLFGESDIPDVEPEKPVNVKPTSHSGLALPRLAAAKPSHAGGLALPRMAAPKPTPVLDSTPSVPKPAARQRANSDDVFAPSGSPQARPFHAGGLALPSKPISNTSSPSSPASQSSAEPIYRHPTPPSPTPAPRKRAPKRRYEVEMEKRNEQASISGQWHDAQRKKAKLDPQAIAAEEKRKAEAARTAMHEKAALEARLAAEQAQRKAKSAARGQIPIEIKDLRWKQPKNINDPAQRKEWLNEDGTTKILEESDELAAIQCQYEDVWKKSKEEKHARKMQKQREARALKEMGAQYTAAPANRNLLAELEAAKQKSTITVTATAAIQERMDDGSEADCDGETDDEFVPPATTPPSTDDDDVMFIQESQVLSPKKSTPRGLKRKQTSSAELAERWTKLAKTAEENTKSARKEFRQQKEVMCKAPGGSKEMALVLD